MGGLFFNQISETIPDGGKTLGTSSSCLRKYESLTTSETILKASVLAIKLLIGNIEANPGPVDFKEFLFVDTEEPHVKEVLKDIKSCQDKQTNMKKIKAKSVEALKATLAYLHGWSKDDDLVKDEIDIYTKEGLVHLVIKKIYNMAPQKCSSCLKTSHFKPGESCVLSCIACQRLPVLIVMNLTETN